MLSLDDIQAKKTKKKKKNPKNLGNQERLGISYESTDEF